MTFLAILGMIAAGLAIAAIGVGVWRRRGGRSRAPVLVRRDEGYTLLCAVCGESAVVFQLKGGDVQANSISNVNRNTYWQGDTSRRLAELLAQGSARAVLDYLASPDRINCPAYCPECDRVYCKEHYSVEDEWSGTWYTAGFATCPLGHKREFE